MDLVISEHDGRAEAVFADGERCWFDRVVLAIGNYPPADPQIRDPQALRCDAYIQDPWKQNAMQRVDLERAVLLLGSGLTTMDMALDLYQRGMRAPMIVLSRRGLLPIAHRQATAPPSFSHQPPGIDAEPATVLGYLRAVRSHVRRLAPQGIDWREVVASLRPITPRMWLLLPPPERARFLRHLRPFWEVHRHRAAPLPHSAFMRLIEQSALRVVAGRLLNLARIPAGFVAHIARRGSSAPLELEVGTVVNCTGPCTDITRLDDVLMRNLLRRGYVRADPLRLGMEVSSELAPLDAAGRSTRVLFYVGPLLRADYWEATAVPELRLHAASVAKVIAESLA